MTALFSTTYLGPLQYFAALVRCREVYLDVYEPWQKQSYRNRCYIDAPNGKLMLNIPINHQKSEGTIGSTFVSADENWRSKHWQAFKTTYNLSPFFDELSPEFKEVLFDSGDKLFELNLALTKMVLRWLRADVKIHLIHGQPHTPYPVSSPVHETLQTKDYSSAFHPKTEIIKKAVAYPQVFAHKHGFLPNLSVVDLCFNEGPAAFDYLSTL
jgi:hypothetical protein